jgi:ring-1,2-phenylacetyl-CoA epoxidase subunit PaaC
MSEATLAEDVSARSLARDLILVLADSKRMLGTRYAEWILGAPELETGIACASMAQDEWGHARLLYALLKDFGEDVERLEHGREPVEYCNIEALDSAPASWADFVALNVLIDAALTVQLQALTESSYTPLRQRVGKLIEEEKFHAAHGLAWSKRLARTTEGKAQLQNALRAVLPTVLRWFGPQSERAQAALNHQLMNASPDVLRERWLAEVSAALDAADVAADSKTEPEFADFDEGTRRTRGTAPDAETIARVRGDKNRAFLMD